jgi:hypothetical protein
MAGVAERRRAGLESTDQAMASITQALFMVGIYAEIVTMDQTIIERVRQLLAEQSGAGDREAHLGNLRLVLAQLQTVGERVTFWNSRVRDLVESQFQ